MDRALLALSALLLNAALAGPRKWVAPLSALAVRAPASWLRAAERKLNRDHRSMADRKWRGAMLAFAVLAISFILGAAIQWLCRHLLPFAEIVILASLLPVRPAWDMASDIRKALAAGDIAPARLVLVGTPWRHYAVLDDHGLARAAIETLAVKFSESIFGAVFWYMLLGLPGLFAAKAVALMQETLPLSGDVFGQPLRQLYAVVNYIPSRLAAMFWLGAALFLPSSPVRETFALIKPKLMLEPPQKLALALVASVLKLSLGGPSSIYSGGAWIGAGSPKAAAADIKRALYLFGFLHLLLFVALGVFLG